MRHGKRLKERRVWKDTEICALKEGVDAHGLGKWKSIKEDRTFGDRLAARSTVDLKDKYRNLIKKQEHSTMKKAKCRAKQTRFRKEYVGTTRSGRPWACSETQSETPPETQSETQSNSTVGDTRVEVNDSQVEDGEAVASGRPDFFISRDILGQLAILFPNTLFD